MKQRDKLREIAVKHGSDPDSIIKAYADAERRGEVLRKSNSHKTTPLQYAKALYNDALRKGWLNDFQ